MHLETRRLVESLPFFHHECPLMPNMFSKLEVAALFLFSLVVQDIKRRFQRIHRDLLVGNHLHELELVAP